MLLLFVLGAVRVAAIALDCVVTDAHDPPLNDRPATGSSTLRLVNSETVLCALMPSRAPHSLRTGAALLGCPNLYRVRDQHPDPETDGRGAQLQRLFHAGRLRSVAVCRHALA